MWPHFISNDRVSHSFVGDRMQKWHIREEVHYYQNLQIQVANEESVQVSTTSLAMHWITASMHLEM